MKKPISIILSVLLLFFSQSLFSQNLTNNGSAVTIMEDATLTVKGNITFLTEVTIDNSGDIFIGGNWINNAPDAIDMGENTGTVSFNGNTPQTIGGINETHFSKLQLEQNTALGSEIKISTLLGLSNARLTINDYHLVMQTGAQIIGAATDAYIVAEGTGLLVREVGALDVEFPTGTSTSFLPVTMNNSGVVDIFGINLFPDVLDGGLTGSAISEIDNCVINTWNIVEQFIGGSDLSVSVQWNASDEGPAFDRTQSGIGHFTEGSWAGQEASSASGSNPYSLTRAGITTLSAFAVGDIDSPLAFTIVYTDQDIFLNEGWSGISSYLLPVDPAVEEILAPVINELVIMQNLTGMYWPGQGINTLGNWNTHSGYQIKMSGEIQLTISGTVETNTTLNLFEGWNLIPVIATCGVDVAELFAGTSVVMVREVAGTAIYWPDFGIGTLAKLLPGSAYMVLMNADEDIVFPACEKAQTLFLEDHKEGTIARLKLKQAMEICGKTELIPTPNIHTIAIPVSAFNGIDIDAGDILEALDEHNNCFGAAQWNGETLSISLFGDDQTTVATDGFGEGKTISFKLYKFNSGEEISLAASYNSKLPDANGLFVTNGISSIAEFKLNPTGIFSSMQPGIKIFPNPATDQIKVLYENPEEASFQIFNMHGLEVLSLTLNNSLTYVNLSMLSPGPYLVKINSRESSYVQRLIMH